MLSNKCTLFVIDDDQRIVDLLELQMSQHIDGDIVIETETDPTAAKERLERGGVDILLTDLEMPTVNGLDLLRCAKARSPHTQVLFLTGRSTQDALLEALEAGASDYLLKPAQPALLAEVVQEAAKRNRRWRTSLAQTWRESRRGADADLAETASD